MKEFYPEIIKQCVSAEISVETTQKMSSMLIEELNKRSIVIYGAGASGKEIAATLREVSVIVEAFIDKKAEEIREVAGIQVYPPAELCRFRGEKLLIIVAVDPQIFKNSPKEIEQNISNYCGENCEIVSYGRDLLYVLRHALCSRKIKTGHKFNIIDCINCGAESRGCEIFMEYLKRTNTKELRENHRQEFTQYFGYIVGQRCTLKCRDCCELVPYYQHGTQVSKDIILGDCRKLAAASKFTMYIELVGGEPFLHPELPEILEGLLQIENVGFVKIFTNGTVIPGERLLEVLKNERIVLMWSNYTHAVQGKLYENIMKTRGALEKAGVRYIFSHAETWLDFAADFELTNKSEEQLQRDFQDCHIADCMRLYCGKLYRCPHHYAGIHTGKLEAIEKEILILDDYQTPEELSVGLYEFRQMPYVEACKRCRLPYDAKEVPAAVQLRHL
ncbi:MAG: hypothetical protein IKC03_09780 [Oscillospiraceae bacterium]|nr:hypothetical protein [Oscillospiraceae bacterium]